MQVVVIKKDVKCICYKIHICSCISPQVACIVVIEHLTGISEGCVFDYSQGLGFFVCPMCMKNKFNIFILTCLFLIMYNYINIIFLFCSTENMLPLSFSWTRLTPLDHQD